MVNFMMVGKVFLCSRGLLSVLAAVCLGCFAAADDHMFSSMSDEGMTLYCPFDAKSDGTGGGRSVKAVSKGTMKERFTRGLRDGAFAAGCRNGETSGLDYPAEKIFSPRRGTLMFWMKAQDWKVSDKGFNIFVSLRSPDNRFGLLVYRQGRNALQMLFNDVKQKKSDSVVFPLKANFVESWHHVAAVWTPEEMRLYVDGLPAGSRRRTVVWPAGENAKNIRIGWRGWKVESGVTLIDEFKLFDRVLDEGAVRAEYRKLGAESRTDQSLLLTAGRRTPVIDGRISVDEYASSGTGFCVRGGVLAVQQSFFYLAHDDRNLYFALKSPQKTPPRAEAAERDGKCWEDDSAELWLELPNKNWYQFIFNTRGTVYDCRFAGKTDPRWNCEGLAVASSVRGGVWELEAAIPLARLENFRNARINIARTFRSGVKEFTHLARSKSGGYGDRKSFIPFRLTDSSDICAVESIGDLAKGKVRVEMRSSRPAEICYRTRSMTGFRGTLSPVAGRIRHNGTYEQDGSGFLTIDVPGVYTGVFRPREQTPVRLDYIYTDTKSRTLQSVLRNMSGTQGTLTLKLAERGVRDGRTFVKKIPATGREIVWTEPWDISGIPAGDYDYIMQFADQQGRAGEPFVQWYRIPGKTNAWDGTRVGLYPGEVPPPWIPLEVAGRRITALTQTYELGDAALPGKLAALGNDILSRPARFVLNGRPLKFDELAVVEKSPDRVVFSGTARSGKITVEVKVLAEYDGMLWFDFFFSGEGAQIGSLYAEFPLKKEFASEVHGFDRGAYKSRYSTGLVPETGWRKNLYSRPAFWIGSETAGLSWYAEDLKGWRFSDPSRTLEILPGKTETAVRLNMIDRPVTPAGRRRISFGLHATPVRPVDREAAASRFNQEWGWSDGTLYYNYFDSGKEFFDAARLRQHQQKYRRKFKEEKLEHSRFFLYIGSNGASPYCPEWGWFGKEWAGGKVGNYIVEYNIKNIAARNKWVWTYACLNSRSFREFLLHQLAAVLRDPRWDVHDLYCDLCGPRMCDNREHGCGYTDEDGRSWGTLNIRGGREFHKRLHHLLQKEHSGGKLMLHVSGQPAVMAIQAFAAGGNLGETWFENDFQAKGFSYIGIFSPDMFRTQCCGAKWGYKVFYTPQFHRANKQLGTGREKLYQAPDPVPGIRRAYRHFLGYILVHDVNTFMGRAEVYLDRLNNLYWTGKRDFLGGSRDVGFIPYWEKNRPFTFAAGPRVMVSAYVKGGRCVMFAMNDTDQEQKVKIDLAGFRKDFRLVPGPEGPAGELRGNILEDRVPARDFRAYFLTSDK